MSIATRYVRPSYMPKFWPVPSDCVLYLEGQQDAYSSTIKDLSGYGNNGTITGATWTKENSGLSSLTFDGNDLVSCGDPASLNFGTGDFSLVTWAKATSSTGYRVIMGKGAGGAGGHRYNLYFDNNLMKLRLELDDNANPINSQGANALTQGQWYLVSVAADRNGNVVVRANTTVEISGACVATATLDQASTNFHWGIDIDGASNGFIGSLWGCRAYKGKVLSASEVSSIYQRERHLLGV